MGPTLYNLKSLKDKQSYIFWAWDNKKHLYTVVTLCYTEIEFFKTLVQHFPWAVNVEHFLTSTMGIFTTIKI